MGFLHRHPFATDAYELGYAVGVREDYSYQIEEVPNVDLPVIMLDNDFRDPDLDRYLEKFERYDPSVAVLGDAYTQEEAEELDLVVEQLRDEHPYKEYVAVPKCREALEILGEDLILGYSMGYSDVQASDFSDIVDWRGLKIHLLGASPPKQYEVIQDLTQPTLTGDPPADIVGLDWNGFHRVAYNGEYWSRDGWQPADQLTVRETVQKSLEEIKTYWQDKGIWPGTGPRDLYGPAVKEPDEPIFMDQGGDLILTREELEHAYVEQYEYKGEDVAWAFQNRKAKQFIEYREGLD
ncbi:DUF6610 family protein [Saliphagus sp. GCM10025334]